MVEQMSKYQAECAYIGALRFIAEEAERIMILADEMEEFAHVLKKFDHARLDDIDKALETISEYRTFLIQSSQIILSN